MSGIDYQKNFITNVLNSTFKSIKHYKELMLDSRLCNSHTNSCRKYNFLLIKNNYYFFCHNYVLFKMY